MNELNLEYQQRVIIFDLDDTLYEEREYVLSAYHTIDRHLQEEIGTQKDECSKVMTHAFDSGINPFDALDTYLKSVGHTQGIDIENLLKIYRFHKPELSLPDDSRATLNALQSAGIKMGLITDGRSLTQRNKIAALEIDRYFEPSNIIISEENGCEKDSPNAFTYFVRKYPNAKGFIYIGDNTSKDFLWPNLLGWDSICLKDRGRNIHSQKETPTDNHAPKLYINNLSEILKLFI